MHKRQQSAHASQNENNFELFHDASFYRGLLASIQDKFRFVFVRHNPSVRGGERACLRATQCQHPGCMSLLRAGLLPLPVSIANVTRLLPSSTNEPWFIASASDAHAASAAEILTAANKISEWAHVGARFRLLEELTQDNFALHTFARPTVIFFTGVADSHNVAIKRVLRAAAAKFLHRVAFGHLNGLRYHGLALKMGSDQPAPSIILVDSSKNFSAVTSKCPTRYHLCAHSRLLGVHPQRSCVRLQYRTMAVCAFGGKPRPNAALGTRSRRQVAASCSVARAPASKFP